jgi:hemolysin activation/secretion protein
VYESIQYLQNVAQSRGHCASQRRAPLFLAFAASAACGMLLSATPLAMAQSRPDAGSLLSPLLPAPAVQPPRTQGLKLPTIPKAPGADNTERVLITSFQIEGAAAIPTEQLQALLAPYRNQSLTLAELEQVAEKLENLYRQRGYALAFVGIPEQSVAGGLLRLQVFEGRLDQINVTGDARLNPEVAKRLMQSAQPIGQAVNVNALERGVALLSDLPGTRTELELAPGSSSGGTEMNLRLQDAERIRGELSLDNEGNRFSGSARASIGLGIANTFGQGDDFSLRAIASSGQKFLRLGHTLPVFDNGTRWGLELSGLRYALCCTFAPLQAQGSAVTWGTSLELPLARERSHRSNLNLSFERKRLRNEASSASTSNKESSSLQARWAGALASPAYELQYALALTAGKLDLSRNAGDLAQDQGTAQAQGGFAKIVWRLNAIWPLAALGSGWSVGSRFEGQFSDANLDSSEKYSLGGANNVRAYPGGEASGDSGALLGLELRKEWGNEKNRYALGLFAESGLIRQHAKPWAGWNSSRPDLANDIGLRGIGLALSWRHGAQWRSKLSYAQRLGSNPLQDANGNDGDGRQLRHRIWLESQWNF